MYFYYKTRLSEKKKEHLLSHCSLSLQFHKVKRYQQGNQWKNHRKYNPIVANDWWKQENIRILTFLEERTHHKR
jgi:hypothetical protein